MIFRFTAVYQYLLIDIEFCFHLSPIFRLLPKKIGTLKKIEALRKRWRTIQSQLRQRTKKIAQNSTIRGAKDLNSFRNL